MILSTSAGSVLCCPKQVPVPVYAPNFDSLAVDYESHGTLNQVHDCIVAGDYWGASIKAGAESVVAGNCVRTRASNTHGHLEDKQQAL